MELFTSSERGRVNLYTHVSTNPYVRGVRTSLPLSFPREVQSTKFRTIVKIHSQDTFQWWKLLIILPSLHSLTGSRVQPFETELTTGVPILDTSTPIQY